MLYQYVLLPRYRVEAEGFVPIGGHDQHHEKYATLEEARYRQCLYTQRTVVRVPAVADAVVVRAAELELSLDAFGRMVWDIAQHLDQDNGKTRDELAVAGFDVRVLRGALLDGIMFESDGGGRRRSPFRAGAWYVIRNYRRDDTEVKGLPKWMARWREVFGGIEGVLDICEEIEVMIAAYHEAQKPKREHDRPYLEEKPTREIAHRAAVAGLQQALYHKVWLRKFDSRDTRDEWGIYSYVAGVWGHEYNVMVAELRYRTEAEPEERSSRKKTDAAIRDWAKAADYLDDVTGGEFFTEDYVRRYMAQDVMPLHVGDVPRDVPERVNAEWQSERELLATVIRLVGLDLDPASFAYDDRELLMKRIRETLAGIKSEYITSPPSPLSIGEGN